MTGLGCVFNKDVSEEGCEISCRSEGLLSGDISDICDIRDICDICDIHNIHNIHT